MCAPGIASLHALIVEQRGWEDGPGAVRVSPQLGWVVLFVCACVCVRVCAEGSCLSPAQLGGWCASSRRDSYVMDPLHPYECTPSTWTPFPSAIDPFCAPFTPAHHHLKNILTHHDPLCQALLRDCIKENHCCKENSLIMWSPSSPRKPLLYGHTKRKNPRFMSRGPSLPPAQLPLPAPLRWRAPRSCHLLHCHLHSHLGYYCQCPVHVERACMQARACWRACVNLLTTKMWVCARTCAFKCRRACKSMCMVCALCPLCNPRWKHLNSGANGALLPGGFLPPAKPRPQPCKIVGGGLIICLF